MAKNPLAEWRQRSKFNPRALESYVFDAEVVEFKHHIWATLLKDPLFGDPDQGLSLEEKRELTFRRMTKLFQYDFLNDEVTMECPGKFLAFSEAIQSFDGSLLPVYSLHMEVCYIHIPSVTVFPPYGGISIRM